MTALLTGLAYLLLVADAYRVGRELEAKKARLQPAVSGAGRCQYSATPSVLESGRPPHESLVALCPTNGTLTALCEQKAKSSASRVVVVPAPSLGIADCERYCNEQLGTDRSTLTDHENDKLTYTKEFCGCEARVVHFPRLEFRSELAIERHNLATLNKEVASRDMEDGSIETKALKSDLADLKAKVKDLALEEVKYKRLEQFEGVYDWLPLRPPHRIAKGAEKVLPTQLVSAIMPGLIQNQNKKFSTGFTTRYWHAPVRVSKIFKKSDLSAFLYLCMDKESKEENWYLATQQDPLVWAGKTFRHLMNQSQDEVSEALSDAKLLQKAFFRLSCVGTKIGRLHNMVKYKAGVLGRHMGHAQEIQAQVKDLEISAVVDKSFLQGSEVPSDVKQPMPLHMDGCYANTKKAADAVEVKVLDEVGACPVDDLAPSKTAEEIFSGSL
eukprot:g15681.t1